MDNNKLTTISDLTPHTIYTIRVEAYTAIGPGPPSAPVQVGTYNRDLCNLTCKNYVYLHVLALFHFTKFLYKCFESGMFAID